MTEPAADNCLVPGLLSVDEAVARLTEGVRPVTESETVPLLDALGRVLANDVISGIDVPGHDNSAMDGYAVSAGDCSDPDAVLKVTQRIAAGSNGTPLSSGEAARIFTGAPVPPGADAVVMQERCEAADDSVTIKTHVDAGANIRRAGEDIANGDVIIAAGKRLREQELGLLASVGVTEVSVLRRLRVACFFTGDELVEPGTPLGAGQIYNSNRYTLNGFLQHHDCEIHDFGNIADDMQATREVIQQAAEEADLVITSGGVSVGEEDYVRLALQESGELEFWRIAMKPGKPVAFGRVGEAMFLGLPGNPVSVFVTAQIFALPLMRKLAGESDILSKTYEVTADFSWPAVKRQEYLRARLEQRDGRSVAVIYPKQGSGVLSSASWADGLIVVPVNTPIDSGSSVDFLPF